MGSSNSVVRMDMKNLIHQEIKIAAISYTFAAAQTLLQEYNKVRREGDGLYMLIQVSDNQANFEKIIVIIICLSFLVLLIISLIWVLFYYFQRFRLLHRQYAAQKKQEKAMKKAFNKMKVETLSSSSELVQNHEEVCCAICIDNFEAGAVVRHLTCKHVYHKKCIDPWLTEKGTCPQCKADILKSLGLGEAVQRPPPPQATNSYESTENVGSEAQNEEQSEEHENEAYEPDENSEETQSVTEESVEVQSEINVSVVKDNAPSRNMLPEVSPENSNVQTEAPIVAETEDTSAETETDTANR